jgi:hypothetical protein
MSKGSPIVTFRIQTELKDEMEKAIESVNQHTAGEPYTVSRWICTAIKQRLDHLARSRRHNSDSIPRQPKTPKATKADEITDSILPHLSL